MENLFVSYNYNDKEIVYSIKGIFTGTVFNLVFANIKTSIKSEIDTELKEKIKQCDKVLFIIGNDNHNSPWIIRESELAISMNKKIFCIRLSGTTGAIPDSLQKYDLIEWKKEEILRNVRGR